MKLKHLLLIIGVLLIALAAMTIRPIQVPENIDDLLVVESKVAKIFEGSAMDIVFKLENNPTRYYINRGLEQDLTISELRRQLIGNKVIIRYPKHWSFMDPGNLAHHLSVLEYNGEDLYNEVEMRDGKK